MAAEASLSGRGTIERCAGHLGELQPPWGAGLPACSDHLAHLVEPSPGELGLYLLMPRRFAAAMPRAGCVRARKLAKRPVRTLTAISLLGWMWGKTVPSTYSPRES